MSSFPDWEQLVEPLTFRRAGKAYVLPELGIQDTVRLNLALDPNTDDDIPADEMEQLLLGDAAAQMRADNVPAWFFDRVFKTAVAEYSAGREVAEQVWATGGAAPKASPSTPEASTPSPSTGTENVTPSPASTSGTTSSRRKRQPSATTTPPTP